MREWGHIGSPGTPRIDPVEMLEESKRALFYPVSGMGFRIGLRHLLGTLEMAAGPRAAGRI